MSRTFLGTSSTIYFMIVIGFGHYFSFLDFFLLILTPPLWLEGGWNFIYWPSVKEPFFWMSNAIGWTNPRKLSCVCRMITRVCALESLWSKLTSEYPSYGLATSRKFSAGVWNFVRRKLGVSKTAKNHRFQTLRRYIGKNRRFLQLKHKNGAAQATMKTPSDELR